MALFASNNLAQFIIPFDIFSSSLNVWFICFWYFSFISIDFFFLFEWLSFCHHGPFIFPAVSSSLFVTLETLLISRVGETLCVDNNLLKF